jgi:hypothetical protein
MTNHIFKEPFPGYVAHKSSSRLLAQDAQLHAWVGFFSEDLRLPIANTVYAMDKGPGSQDPRETGFQIANNTNNNFFEHFSKHPDRLKRYGTAMAANAASEGYHVRHVVENYPWESLGEATVVDVYPLHSQSHYLLTLLSSVGRRVMCPLLLQRRSLH